MKDNYKETILESERALARIRDREAALAISLGYPVKLFVVGIDPESGKPEPEHYHESSEYRPVFYMLDGKKVDYVGNFEKTYQTCYWCWNLSTGTLHIDPISKWLPVPNFSESISEINVLEHRLLEINKLNEYVNLLEKKAPTRSEMILMTPMEKFEVMEELMNV